MTGMVHEIADLGLERAELGRAFGNAHIGGASIPYEPKELAGIVTLLRGFAPKSYLAIEGMSEGGWRYIAKAASIPQVVAIRPQEPLAEIKKTLRDNAAQTFDLISIDARGFPMGANGIWKYIMGGKDEFTRFGQGIPTNYGPRKWRPGTVVIFNLADEATKALYFKIRTIDNKIHQSAFAGMVKL